MFIRRELAVSLSLLFVLSLFFPLKTVMAASPAAPVPAPPAVVPRPCQVAIIKSRVRHHHRLCLK